jgi:hypothetical protein
MRRPISFFDEINIAGILGERKYPGVDMDAILASKRREIEKLRISTELAKESIINTSSMQSSVLINMLDEIRQKANSSVLVDKTVSMAIMHMTELADIVVKQNTELRALIDQRILESMDAMG